MSALRWPDIFNELSRQLEATGEYRRVFEAWTYQDGEDRCTRLLCSGLLDSRIAATLPDNAEFGFDVQSNSPESLPEDPDDAIKPAFWIWSSVIRDHVVEPLVLSWTSNEMRSSQLDPGFLLTYRLCPRLIVNGSTIEWDKPDLPDQAIARGVPVGVQHDLEEAHSYWDVKHSYLQDYSSLRGKAILLGFYELRRLPETHGLRAELRGATDREFRSRGFSLRYHLEPTRNETGTLFVELRGFRVLAMPGPAPISSDEYGELAWPGIREPIRETEFGTNAPMLEYIFVQDQVLEKFEGDPRYSISPESGAVSLGSQWAVGYCERYGRDLIRLEVKKLYEGTPAWVVRHYHSYCVSRPDGEPQTMLELPNIARRARRICRAYLNLGRALFNLLRLTGSDRNRAQDFIGVRRDHLAYAGWWSDEYFAQLAHHCPRDMSEAEFLARAKNLFRATIERLRLSCVRDLLRRLKFLKRDVEDQGSLAGLIRIAVLCRTASHLGLILPNDAKRARMQIADDEELRAPLAALHALNHLRQLDAHFPGGSKPMKLRQALQSLGVDPNSVATGYGLACDALFDRVADSLEYATSAIDACLKEATETHENE